MTTCKLYNTDYPGSKSGFQSTQILSLSSTTYLLSVSLRVRLGVSVSLDPHLLHILHISLCILKLTHSLTLGFFSKQLAKMNTAVFCSALLALICCVSFATSLHCYVCNSEDAAKESKKCGTSKDVDEHYKVDCSKADAKYGGDKTIGNWTVCRKIVTWVDYSLNENDTSGSVERVMRKCGYNEEKHADACFYRGGLGGRQRVCSCKEDGCNSAPKTSMTIITLLGAFIPVFIVTLFQ
ncbi:unnamed protein product [Allacma fusca]|uniref:Protein quiver n=1 Tax=Allacma fusca TaxID=39272 RepID=A0A8J2MEH3_9HEXA|nr:unnamed protein product [Allacma fusca]